MRHCQGTDPQSSRNARSATCSPQIAAAREAPGAAGRRPIAPRSAGAAAARTDFDFLLGQWIAANRRLAEPLTPMADWTTFDTVHTCRPLLMGLGHIDELAGDDLTSATTLRLLDVERRQWTIHRVSSVDGVLRPPLAGLFDGGVGVFVGADCWRSESVLVRHTWTRSAEKPHWEQAFSADGGRTWETNWVMDYHRIDWPQ